MTIQEVIKTKKAFRRRGTAGWYLPPSSAFLLSQSDLIADDWEIREIEEKIEFTKTDIVKAWIRCSKNILIVDPLETFLQELGFKS